MPPNPPGVPYGSDPIVRKTSSGTAWQMFAIMDDARNLVKVVAKDPARAVVIDITPEIARLVRPIEDGGDA